MEALLAHRLQFAFTITYHYLFPQLTMGLALLIFILKTQGLRNCRAADAAARFWSKVLGLTFVMGVVTGIPLEFQFGTNWARFSEASGGIIGQTLAMEGVFAFFLESSFLYLLIFKERSLGPRMHWITSLLVFVGTWLSGWFIVSTNAFMQHPVGHEVLPDGSIVLKSLIAFLTNPWAFGQYAHTMLGSVITASFVMAGLSAFYLLLGKHHGFAKHCLKLSVVTAVLASALSAFPTGDLQAKMVAKHQPVTFAAMEGHFQTEEGAGLVVLGQPNMETMTLDNPLIVPNVLSFMTHMRWNASVVGLEDFDKELWPDNIPLLYYSYHIMVGLGTLFIALMSLASFLLFRGCLFEKRWILWMLLLATPFPFIANTTGWMTAEMGRQPWLIHGIMRTAQGTSVNVSAGNVWFTLLGFMGLYALLSILYLLLMSKIIAEGPLPIDDMDLHDG